MPHIGFWEILLILVVIAVLFGGKKLPELGKGLGQAIRNFKSGIKDNDEEPSQEKKDEKNH